KVAESYFKSFDVPVVTVRPFNTYGPRQSARAVIPTIITQALVGHEIALGSLTPTRDLTYVRDTVGGMIAAAEAENVEGLEINLGTGTEISVGTLAETIARLIGKDVRILTDEARLRPSKSEVGRLLADNRLAAERIDWKPSKTLEDGLSETIEWIRDHIDSYRPGIYEV
ncbi:MAG: hypothetical protein QOH90_285, partial [Actinomycetota bacterium]|nr:hypothetical protein [Actinomycetota bacterium]